MNGCARVFRVHGAGFLSARGKGARMSAYHFLRRTRATTTRVKKFEETERQGSEGFFYVQRRLWVALHREEKKVTNEALPEARKKRVRGLRTLARAKFTQGAGVREILGDFWGLKRALVSCVYM